MERPTTTMLRIGAWCVNPSSGQISRDGETARVEVRTMRLLLRLAEHAGDVVSIGDLLGHVCKQPTYIETVPRLGYRMVATVSPWADQSVADASAQTNAQTSLHSEHPTPAVTDAPDV